MAPNLIPASEVQWMKMAAHGTHGKHGKIATKARMCEGTKVHQGFFFENIAHQLPGFIRSVV